MKSVLIMMFLLMLSACHACAEEQVVASGGFIYNRLNAHYHVSIERHNKSVGNSIGQWINQVVNDHIRWTYEANPASSLHYRSRDFARQYRAYAHYAAQQYDKELSASRNNVGRGEVMQNDTLRIRKTTETAKSVTYTAQEYFCRGTTHPTRYKLTATFDKKTGKLQKNELIEIE